MKEKLLDYSQSLKEFNKANSLKVRVEERESDRYNKLCDKYKELDTLRKNNLENILEKKGLAICSNNRWGNEHGERHSLTKEEKLGVFQKSQMRLLYTSRIVQHDGAYGYSWEREISLKLLCPHCFPEKPNHIEKSRSVLPKDNGVDISSEVIEKDRRLITIINEIDVTDMPVEKHHYSEEMYEHFGLPKLPESPSAYKESLLKH